MCGREGVLERVCDVLRGMCEEGETVVSMCVLFMAAASIKTGGIELKSNEISGGSCQIYRIMYISHCACVSVCICTILFSLYMCVCINVSGAVTRLMRLMKKYPLGAVVFAFIASLQRRMCLEPLGSPLSSFIIALSTRTHTHT